MERRLYGNRDDNYDNLLFGLIKTRSEKKKESQERSQRDANINLTNRQNEIAAAKAQAEVYRAQAEQMKALAEKKNAEKADVQLSGARATTNLKYVGITIAAIVGVGAVALTVYMIKQGKKAALISARLQKAKLAKVAA